MRTSRFALSAIAGLSALAVTLTACSNSEKDSSATATTTETTTSSSATTTTTTEAASAATEGDKVSAILGAHPWIGTKVIGEDGTDLTEYNKDFISVAIFDATTNRYEFFDTETLASKGDSGVFFITPDGARRVTISSKGYQAALKLTEVGEDIFTYERKGKDASGNEVQVQVEHRTYNGDPVTLTETVQPGTSPKAASETRSGNEILGSTLWQGTKVLDDQGNDVTEFNQGFISIARFDNSDGRYEFFDTTTGETKGDYGFFAVVNNDSERATVSLGKKYGADLPLTELSSERFTYSRQGKDAQGNEIHVLVEHEPYTGEFNPQFTQN